MKRIVKYKKYILCVIAVLIILTILVGIKYIMLPKYEELPEVKLKSEINKNKTMAIMISEDGTNYKEYKGETWPGNGYRFKEAKCIDNNGSKVDNVVTYNNGNVILETDQTVYCTLYFDYEATGEEDAPYRIQYIEDLVELQVAVNNGETYEGKYFEIVRDLDFEQNESYKDYQTKEYGDINGTGGAQELKTELTTGAGWKPIGVEAPFSGILNGNNHKIANLYINNSAYSIIGLFGGTYNSVIKNLKITGSVKSTSSLDTVAGSLVGHIRNTIIENVENYASVTVSNTNSKKAGGIAGFSSYDTNVKSQNIIKNSINHGNITNGTYVGGIVGYNYRGSILYIDNCYNSGTISTGAGWEPAIGGAVGYTYGTSYILNFYNIGNVQFNSSITKSSANGVSFAGYGGKLYIINSYNKGSISNGTWTNAGIASTDDGNNGTNTLKIYNAYNIGKLTGTYTYGITWHTGTFDSKYTYTTPTAGQEFVDTLNENKNNIDLNSIDSSLSEYTLCDWKLDSSGYPELAC